MAMLAWDCGHKIWMGYVGTGWVGIGYAWNMLGHDMWGWKMDMFG
jgi:hypothetical protein